MKHILRPRTMRFCNVLFVCGIFFIAVLWYQQPSASSTADIQAEAHRGGYQLVDMSGLRELYQKADSKILLVDTRQDWEYHAGHIKGALNFSMEPTWLARLTQRGALEQFLGADKTKTIVFY